MHAVLTEILLLLAAAVFAVPLFRRFGLGAVLGYLFAGVLIGPSFTGLISDVTRIQSLSELGVVLLLFVIGLELQPSRLWVLRRPVFGLGSLQVAGCSLLFGGLAAMLGLHWQAALVAGVALSLSSTAVVLQVMSERRELTTRHGRVFAAHRERPRSGRKPLRQPLGGSRTACLPRFRRFSGAPHAGKAQEIPPGTPARGRGRCHLSLGTGG